MTATTLRVYRTHFPVTALGPGQRLGIWLQGCPLACKGCMSRDTWDPAGGRRMDISILTNQWRRALDAGAIGLTVSGGEPLTQAEPLAEFLDTIRSISAGVGTEHDILMFTGYELAELDETQRATAARADVLVTGRFVAAEPTELRWRGSANQSMVIQTELGRRRYGPYLEDRPEHPPIQVRADADGVWIIGVPRRGTLARLDHRFRAHGLAPSRVSWRPDHRQDDGSQPQPDSPAGR